MKLFKRNFDKRPRKEKSVLLRFSILVVGAMCFVIYGYMTGHKYITGEDLVTEVTHIQDVNHFMSMSDESWTQGGMAGYARVLTHANNTDENAKCTDEDHYDQPSVCVGYGGSSCKKVGPDVAAGALIGVILGLLYLFVGIAIVCDELFVPALEIIAEDLELSNDVAGATLMAAGGSAPELATSFVGAFKRSDVGFGTIVGSAVFNVLFVIAMCVIATPVDLSPLTLTWWPLFRDCSYYVVTLAFLAGFMSDGKIEIYEALIQLILYFIYVYLMSKNEQLEAFFTKLFGLENYNAGGSAKIAPEDADSSNVLDQSIEAGKTIGDDIELTKSMGADATEKPSSNVNLNKPSTFRVGILQLMTSKLPITETAGIAFVSQIKGDVDAVFKRIDTNQNGEIDLGELKTCLKELGTPEDELTDEAVQSIMKDIDKSNNGHANKNDFTIWYTRAETRLKNKTREIFEKYATQDGGDKNTINKDQVYKFMSELGHHDTPGVEKAMQEMLNAIETPHMTLEQFTQWYENSVYWDAEKASAEQAAEAQESMWQGVLTGFNDFHEMPYTAKISFVLFLPLSLICCLIPDCRPPGKEKMAVATLLCSVLMIALFSIVMVELAEIFGKTIGIPDVVMGLTILAAGTSVPDLLSSVIVAKQGEGDMAVSSSIGSNIFDVAFGLPLPWLTFDIVALVAKCECEIRVSGDTQSLLISICTLLAMVAAIILIIMYNGWKMTHYLGYSMFALYFIYLGFALGITPPSQYTVDDCSPFKLF